ncbi:MAG: hypothetical protein CEN90_463 [Parcubacteria group bacterium Licking1014_17]|nr:MAG: hypothetical protein CEN90_463 [Parcubacteria group bacterium Licking1014_17]
MKSRVRFALLFLISVLLLVIVLNGRYFYANAVYSLNQPVSNSTPAPEIRVFIPPVKEVPNVKPLPDSATLVIPKINVSVPIVFDINGNSEKSIYDNLNRGAVHYSNTPKPGMLGTAMIFGHSSDYIWKRNAYASVFALLDKLEPGDVMYVKYSDGRRFDFRVNQKIIFDPNANDWRIQEMASAKTPTLMLISCWPVGTASKRIAVEAIGIK